MKEREKGKEKMSGVSFLQQYEKRGKYGAREKKERKQTATLIKSDRKKKKNLKV